MGAIKAVARDEAIANLDKVREIILDDSRRLNMGDWHQDGSKWQEHTCAEEALCGTTHCLAGWLQVCATDERVRKFDAFTAGCIQAPMAASLFYSNDETVLAWLKAREYAKAEVRGMTDTAAAGPAAAVDRMGRAVHVALGCAKQFTIFDGCEAAD